jgi:hypothetical protein
MLAHWRFFRFSSKHQFNWLILLTFIHHYYSNYFSHWFQFWNHFERTFISFDFKKHFLIIKNFISKAVIFLFIDNILDMIKLFLILITLFWVLNWTFIYHFNLLLVNILNILANWIIILTWYFQSLLFQIFYINN